MPGRLIVFEGVEGAGKTTQLERLALRLGRHGAQVRTLREPGGTPVGDEIRALLLRPGAQIPPRTEALLFMASRAALVDEQVRPALARGEIVLLDRFFLSTYAYQVGGRGLPEDAVRDANAFATGGLVPDVTVLLTLPVV
ncbi:MAG: dTMP kinase, partial [Gemmatimonadaceae bacterium]|nr:dTMP kinase [Gemmatimonadaceae bacterium]